MDIHFTARRFKAHQEVRDHALASIKRLDHYYDGIVRSDIILSFEKKPNSVKIAEINVHVNRTILTAKNKSEDFVLSIDLALEKIMRQLDKYKSKIRLKDKRTLRRLKEEQV
jgi:putative sigma-54 modulation protein